MMKESEMGKNIKIVQVGEAIEITFWHVDKEEVEPANISSIVLSFEQIASAFHICKNAKYTECTFSRFQIKYDDGTIECRG